MTPENVTKITTAFAPDKLVDTFVSMAPFIMGVVGVLVVIGVVSWAVRRIRRRLSGGVA